MVLAPPASRARLRSRWSSGSPIVSIGAVTGTSVLAASTAETPDMEPKCMAAKTAAPPAAKAASTASGVTMTMCRRASR